MFSLRFLRDQTPAEYVMQYPARSGLLRNVRAARDGAKSRDRHWPGDIDSALSNKKLGEITMTTAEMIPANHETEIETLEPVELGRASQETRGSFGTKFDGGSGLRH
jgi:hypothetical protein